MTHFLIVQVNQYVSIRDWFDLNPLIGRVERNITLNGLLDFCFGGPTVCQKNIFLDCLWCKCLVN